MSTNATRKEGKERERCKVGDRDRGVFAIDEPEKTYKSPKRGDD